MVHHCKPGARSVGVSRGKAHFLCGDEISLFVIQELGMLLDGEETCGIIMHRMVVTFMIEFPGMDKYVVTFHIIPVEYLEDPILPSLPTGLNLKQTLRWIPPPPTFHQGYPVGNSPNLTYAWIVSELSEREASKSGGGASLLGLSIRGASYYCINGLDHLPARSDPQFT